MMLNNCQLEYYELKNLLAFSDFSSFTCKKNLLVYKYALINGH